MKTTALFITFLIAQIAVKSHTPSDKDNEKGITFFEGSWQEALVLARQENKLIFLDAYASWCGPCRMMKSRIFSTKQVGDFFNANFINVKMDMEKGEGVGLAQKYGVTAYPTLFFIDAAGNVKKYSVGYHNTDELIEFGKHVLK